MSCPKHSVRLRSHRSSAWPQRGVTFHAIPRTIHYFHLWRAQPGAMGNPNTLIARLPARRHIGPPPNSCNARSPGERATQPPTAPGVDTPPCCSLRLGRTHAATYEPAEHVHCPVPLSISLSPSHLPRPGPTPWQSLDPRTGRDPPCCGVAPYSLASARLSHWGNDRRCRPGPESLFGGLTGRRGGEGLPRLRSTIAETGQGVGDEKGCASDFPAGTYTVDRVGEAYGPLTDAGPWGLPVAYCSILPSYL